MNDKDFITDVLSEYFFKLRDMHSAALETLKNKTFFGYRLFACGKMTATFIIFSPRLRSFTLLKVDLFGRFERLYKVYEVPAGVYEEITDKPGSYFSFPEINVFEMLNKSFDKKQLRFSFGY